MRCFQRAQGDEMEMASVTSTTAYSVILFGPPGTAKVHISVSSVLYYDSRIRVLTIHVPISALNLLDDNMRGTD
jgi:replication-associated recombination protein RarA